MTSPRSPLLPLSIENLFERCDLQQIGGRNYPSVDHEHRGLLRARFLAGGSSALLDIDFLELILLRVDSRRDVNPLAQLLLDTFGDLNRVLSAPTRRLEMVAGASADVVFELKIVEAAAHRLARSKVMKKDVISNWSELINYCHAKLAHCEKEHFLVLFLDTKNVLIADEEQCRGTVNHVQVYPREVAKRALELNATALILVHNHPSGDSKPSPADVEMTQRINSALQTLNLTVHDHIIIGKSGNFSFKSAGYL